VNGQIAFARFNPVLGDTQLYVVNPDGNGERLAQPSTDTLECPQWSPDSTLISGCGGPPGCASLLWNPDNSTSHCVPSNPAEANLFFPCGTWSSDGSRLYCEGFGLTDPSLNGIYSVRTSDGGDLRQVTSTPGGDDIPGDASPNGDKLVFNRTASDALFVVNANGTGLKQITPSKLAIEFDRELVPAGQPDRVLGSSLPGRGRLDLGRPLRRQRATPNPDPGLRRLVLRPELQLLPRAGLVARRQEDRL
jgi:hypothetical protein